MLVWWMWLMWAVSHAWANISNVTSHASANDSNTTSVFSYNDKCSNLCKDDDNTHWCRNRRIDQQGVINRCVEYTRYGRPCVTACFESNDEKYRWCKTNPVQTKNSVQWDYCSLEGLTYNGKECVDACETRNEDYYYCHTSSSWDYCSPPGQVKPLQLTVKGAQCKGECVHTEDYTWCTKNQYCKSCGEWWDYCSLDSTRTRKGAQCKDSCSTRGEDYYWCKTEGSWDYCSPKAEDGVHISLEVELDIYGNECINLCSTYGEKYFWCANTGNGNSWWDYCSPPGKTIYNTACRDSCSRRGESFHWCHTAGGWDYCSPKEYTGEHSSTGEKAQASFLILILIQLGLLLP